MEINPIEFGRVLGVMESIQAEIRELKERSIFRLDNLEGRIELLERDKPQVDKWGKWVDRAVSSLVGIGLATYFTKG